MKEINYVAVVVAAAAAFVVGGLWYSPLLFGKIYLSLRGLDPQHAGADMAPRVLVAEFARWLLIAFVLARFIQRLDVASLAAALGFSFWMWLIVYTALAGAVLHEGAPWRVYAIHAGDGLAKIVVLVTMLVLWPKG